MDKHKSLQLFGQLEGKELASYKVVQLINNGKSAAVFKAEKDGIYYALKIFDSDIIERFGHEIQTKRIEQEISLKGHDINNLVKIYEGGKTNLEGLEYYYIIMELIDGVNLKDFIAKNTYNQSFILKVLNFLVNTTEHLLIEKHIAHRDIKPENVMVDNSGNIVLMDLGVLKLIGAKSFSDDEEKSFVGTLRYAPPEFLLRNEEDSADGWRAVNIYQIGATLHDLIMKRELFFDKSPYSNLVIAIKDDNPTLANNEYSFELIQLTRDMLTKNPSKRNQLVTIQRITDIINKPTAEFDSLEANIEEILKMRVNHIAKYEEIENLKRTQQEMIKKRNDLGRSLAVIIDECFNIIKGKNIFTSFSKSENFVFSGDTSKRNFVQNYLYELTGELKMGFPSNLYFLIRIVCDEDNFTEINTVAVFPSVFAKPNLQSPLNFFKEIYPSSSPGIKINSYGPMQVLFNFHSIELFKGVVEIDDTLINHLTNQLVKILYLSLQKVESQVESRLDSQKRAAETRGVYTRVSTGMKNIIIDFM